MGPVSSDNKTTMGRSGGSGNGNGNGAPIGWMDLKNMGSKIRVHRQRGSRNTDSSANADPSTLSEVTSNDGLLSEGDEAEEGARGAEGGNSENGAPGDGATVYKVYKRRWFGLFQLALLNIIVSWDVRTNMAISSTAVPWN